MQRRTKLDKSEKRGKNKRKRWYLLMDFPNDFFYYFRSKNRETQKKELTHTVHLFHFIVAVVREKSGQKA